MLPPIPPLRFNLLPFHACEMTFSSSPFPSLYITYINFQSELLVAAEAAKTTQRKDLEGHLKSSQSALREKGLEAEKLEAKLSDLQAQLVAEREKSNGLASEKKSIMQELKLQEERGNNLKEKCREMVRTTNVDDYELTFILIYV